MEIMDLSTKRIITVTVEYDFSDDPELAATLTDKKHCGKNGYGSDFRCVY